MSKFEFDLIADEIDAELDHLHKQRWEQRAAKLHAEGAVFEQARQALRDYCVNRLRPETSRIALLDQAETNYAARRTTDTV